MRSRVGLAISLAALTMGVGCQNHAPETPSSSAPATTRRPSPIDEHLPRPAATIAEDSVRTRVAEAAEPAKTPATDSQPELGGTDWAVVAAIYRDYDAAERRARDITIGSAFKAGVFPAKGQGSKYMVVLDAGLTQGTARQLRERAVSGGLPPDTYVTRLIRGNAAQTSAPEANRE